MYEVSQDEKGYIVIRGAQTIVYKLQESTPNGVLFCLLNPDLLNRDLVVFSLMTQYEKTYYK